VWHTAAHLLLSVAPVPGPNPIVKARVDHATRAQIAAHALSRGVSESELLRQALRRELDGDPRPAQPAAPERDETSTARITVRIPSFVADAAKMRAQAAGMAPSRWIANLVQSNVARHPVLADCELQSLEATTRELAALGRNINQIARALNQAHFEAERIRLDRLADLAALIATIREEIRSLVRASRNVWGTE
jgi:predicted DNA binding CopG/RHH family protein